jgi:uncharacterized protein with NRDE domain
MCTVTYAPIDGGFVVTSNRDEYHQRETDPPTRRDKGLYYPKDATAGGSWIAANNQGYVVCLLNGAFDKHKHHPPYSKSRGKIVLEAAQAEDSLQFAQQCDLQGVEPFTLILVKKELLIELRWDGTDKFLSEKDTNEIHIWASPTLYDDVAFKLREQWLENYLETHSGLSVKERFWDFHNTQHGNDLANDIVMKRANGLKTVSISQVQVATDVAFRYKDLKKNLPEMLLRCI